MGQHGGMRTAVRAVVALTALATALLPGVAEARTASPTYYVSLGDSYSVGYQPGLGSTPGYTVYVARRTHLTLANFGCAGATTTSVLDTIGCPAVLPHTAGGMAYPATTQIAAAEAFLTAHRGRIGLITVTIGGNDVTSCVYNPNPIRCVGAAVSGITTNVTALASDLRTAAGPRVPIIGLTYPDVVLGSYVFPSRSPTVAATSLANLSVVAFKSLINPTLSKAYGRSTGSFVDVTAATGAYTPLNRTVRTTTYGRIPVPVATVCALTWFCATGDIHAKTPGYTLIGKLVVARYAALRRA
jgi:lysophospholipase L1-like esterase